MAGKSGLNITKDESFESFLVSFYNGQAELHPILEAFQARDIMARAHEFGSETFPGLTKRAFPKVMKASPLLRAWLAKFSTQGVQLRTQWRWTDGDGRAFVFDTPDGTKTLHSDVTILALGGASWPKLGSDGAWTSWFTDKISRLRPLPRAMWPFTSIGQSILMPNLASLSNQLPFEPTTAS